MDNFPGIFVFFPYDQEEESKIYPELEIKCLYIHSIRKIFSLLTKLWHCIIMNCEAFQILSLFSSYFVDLLQFHGL